jgi:hypothetical protein
MFVVYLEPPQGEPPFKHPFKAFSARPAAEAFAAEQVAQDAERALIYDVPSADDARKAIEAIKIGAGIFVAAKGQAATEEEIDREWARAMAGNETALMKFLQD